MTALAARRWLPAFCAAGIVLAVLAAPPVAAQDADPHAGHGSTSAPGTLVKKPRLFLDKSPRIVAYQLARLSNEELILADRNPKDAKFEPVYWAMLTRSRLAPQYRDEAVDALVGLTGFSAGRVLLAGIERLDADDPAGQFVARELSARLLAGPPADSTPARKVLSDAAAASPSPLARRAALARLLVDMSVEQVWALVEAQTQGRIDLFDALPLVSGEHRPRALRARVVAALDPAGDIPLRQSAVRALAYLPTGQTENFRLAANLLFVDELSSSAVTALRTISKEFWPAADAEALAAGLVDYAATVPLERRTEDAFLDAMQLADDLMALLPAVRARELRDRLGEITVRVVRLGTVREEMRYDQPYFVVEAGKAVQVVLENHDAMPHNFVVTAPGAMREVAMLAATMAPPVDPQSLAFVPDSDKVLFATRLVQPAGRESLSFTAPLVPAPYPYVCTFPNHWYRMYGVMLVVEDLAAWQESPTPPDDPLGNTRAIVQRWKMEDFTSDDVGERAPPRAQVGQRIFVEAGCNRCHKIEGDGASVGPELTETFQRWKNRRGDVLREIIEPSRTIEEKYVTYSVVTADGRILTGIVTAQQPTQLTLLTNPDAPEPVVISREDIDDIQRAAASMMPRGLLDRFTKDEIASLLDYLQAVGRKVAGVTRGASATPAK